MKHIDLDGKAAIVTGASRGIGHAIAQAFVDAGGSVVLVSRKAEDLEDATAAMGPNAVAFAANVGDIEAGERCVELALERFGRLDVLVNNAAANPYYGPAHDVDVARFDKTFQTNLRGPWFWSQVAQRRAFADRPGVIINVASTGGFSPEPGIGVYNVTKAGLIHLTRQMASEVGPTRVVGIAPGLVDTDFAAALVKAHGERLAAQLPMGRIGKPEDIGNLAVFLASDLAGWITGQTYIIDGGASVVSGLG